MAQARLKKLSRIRFSGLDYDTVKSDIENYLRTKFPDRWTDFTSGGAGEMFVELFSYFAEMLGYRIDVAANECAVIAARSGDSISKLLSLVDYQLKSVSQATIEIDATRLDGVSIINKNAVDSKFYDVSVADYANGIVSYVTASSQNRDVVYTVMNNQFDYFTRVVLPHVFERDASGATITVNASSSKIKAYEGIVVSDVITDITGSDYQSYTTTKPNVIFGSLKAYIDRGNGWEQMENKQYLNALPQPAQSNKIVFRQEYTSDFRVKVVFGSSDVNNVPMPGTRVRLIYMTGTGSLGNMPARSVNHKIICPIVDSAGGNPNEILDYINVQVINERPATGGLDSEDALDAAPIAPLRLKTVEKMVTREDYKILIEQNPSIKEVFVEDDSVNDQQDVYTVNLYVLQSGAVDPESYMSLNSSLYDAIVSYVNQKKVIGIDNVVLPAEAKLIKIEVYVKKNEYADASKVKDNIALAIENYVNNYKSELGENIEHSEIISIIQRISGVDYVEKLNLLVSPDIVVEFRSNEVVVRTMRKASDASLEVLHKTPKNLDAQYNYLQQFGDADYDPFYHTYKKLKNNLLAYDKNGVFLGEDKVNDWTVFSYNFNERYDYDTKIYSGKNPRVENGESKASEQASVANPIGTYVLKSLQRGISIGQGDSEDHLHNYFYTQNTPDRGDDASVIYLLLEVYRPDGTVEVAVPFSYSFYDICVSEGFLSYDSDDGEDKTVPGDFPTIGFTNAQLCIYFNWYINKYYSQFSAKDQTGVLDLWMETYSDNGVKLLSRNPFKMVDSRIKEKNTIIYNNASQYLSFDSVEAYADDEEYRYLPITNGTIIRQGENMLWLRINGRSEYVELPLSKPSVSWQNPSSDVGFVGTAFNTAEIIDGVVSIYEFDEDNYTFMFSHNPYRNQIVKSGSVEYWALNTELELSDNQDVLNTFATGSVNDVLVKMSEDFGEKRTLAVLGKNQVFPSDIDLLNVWKQNKLFFDQVSSFYEKFAMEYGIVFRDDDAKKYGYDTKEIRGGIDRFIIEVMRHSFGTFRQFVSDLLNTGRSFSWNIRTNPAALEVFKRLDERGPAEKPPDKTSPGAGQSGVNATIGSESYGDRNYDLTMSLEKDVNIVQNALNGDGVSLNDIEALSGFAVVSDDAQLDQIIKQSVTAVSPTMTSTSDNINSFTRVFVTNKEYNGLLLGSSYLLKKYADDRVYISRMKTLMDVLYKEPSLFPMIANPANYKYYGAATLINSSTLSEFVLPFVGQDFEMMGQYMTFVKGAKNDFAGWISYNKYSSQFRPFHTLAYEISRHYAKISQFCVGAAGRFGLIQKLNNGKYIDELPNLLDDSWNVYSQADYSDFEEKNRAFKELVANTYVLKVPRTVFSDGDYLLQAKAVKTYDDIRFTDLDGNVSSKVVYIQRDIADTNVVNIEKQVLPVFTVLNCANNTVEVFRDGKYVPISAVIKSQIDTEADGLRKCTITASLEDSAKKSISELYHNEISLAVESEDLPIVTTSDNGDEYGISVDQSTDANWYKLVMDCSFYGEKIHRIEIPILEDASFGGYSFLSVSDIIKRINSKMYIINKRFLYSFARSSGSKIGFTTSIPYLKFVDTSQFDGKPYLNTIIGVDGKVLDNTFTYDISSEVFDNLQLNDGLYYVKLELELPGLETNEELNTYVRVYWNQKADYESTLSTEELANAIVAQIPNENKNLNDNITCLPKQFPMFDKNNNYLKISIR